jgi:lipoyl(octanoyl) transferase
VIGVQRPDRYPEVRPLEELLVRWLGRVPYRAACDEQARLVARRRSGAIPDTLLLLEHPPVITLGRSGDARNVLADRDELARRGIEFHEAGRGGDVTYHGPGQLVGYPIVNLAPDRKDLWKYVRNLEEAIIGTLAAYGIEGRRFQKLTGVWIGEEKVAAIGVRVSRWVTSHGFALNVSSNLDHFRTIVPCGIRNYGVTSLERIMSDPPGLEAIGRDFAYHFAEIFERELVWISPASTPSEAVSS